MAEDWDVYVSPIDDHAAVIFVDLAPGKAPPDALRPWLLCVSIDLQIQREDGLSDPEETDVLYAIEDSLFESVAKTLRARYVGRITSQGKREHFYYANSPEGFVDAAASALRGFDRYQANCRHEEDSAWNFYSEVLFPGDIELQSIHNRRLVEQLRQSGDDLTEPRDIDHWMYFPSEEHRDQFLLQVAGNGFRSECTFLETPDANFRYGVHLTRRDRVDLETIDGLVTDLFLRARNCGGEYDGWGASVIRPG